MGCGDKGIAASEACSQHTELFVTLRFQPVEAAANVHHRLAAGFGSSADIGAYGIVRPLQLGWPPDVMVGLREPKRRDSEAIEERAERIVAEGVRVPLRHHDDRLFRLARLLFRWCRVPAKKQAGKPKQAIIVMPQWNADAFSHNA